MDDKKPPMTLKEGLKRFEEGWTRLSFLTKLLLAIGLGWAMAAAFGGGYCIPSGLCMVAAAISELADKMKK